MKPKKLAQNGLVTACGVVVAFLLAEGGLRLAGVSYPRWLVPDYYRGFALLPGVAGWWRSEGEAYVRISRQGLRDREHPVRKPSGTLRVAVLGDSFAQAFELPADSAFWAVAARELARCPVVGGRPVEFINFGVSGYGTAQELITLRHVVRPFSPDVVLLAFLTGNDVRNNSPALEPMRERPFFVLSGDTLALDTSYRAGVLAGSRSPLRRMIQAAIDHSRVLQVVNHARVNLAERRAAAAETAAAAAQAAAARTPAALVGEAGLDNHVYLQPPDSAWENAWRVTERLLGEVDAEARRQGARLLVATLSNGAQVQPDPAVRARTARELGVRDLLYPDRRVRAAAERYGIPVLTLAPVLADSAAAVGAFAHGFDGKGLGHWNAFGHRVAGHEIARALCRTQLLGAAAAAR